jgi:hypothetical protein
MINDKKTSETDESKRFFGMPLHAGRIWKHSLPIRVGPPYPIGAPLNHARILLLKRKYRRASNRWNTARTS